MKDLCFISFYKQAINSPFFFIIYSSPINYSLFFWVLRQRSLSETLLAISVIHNDIRVFVFIDCPKNNSCISKLKGFKLGEKLNQY